MTSVDTADAAPPGARGPGFIPAIELLDALSSVQGTFIEYHHETALLRFAI